MTDSNFRVSCFMLAFETVNPNYCNNFKGVGGRYADINFEISEFELEKAHAAKDVGSDISHTLRKFGTHISSARF